MTTLWAYGAVQQQRLLRSSGQLRGLTLVDQANPSKEMQAGLAQSVVVSSLSKGGYFVFEWDESRRVKHKVGLF